MKVLAIIFFTFIAPFSKAQGTPDTIPLNDSYLCDTFIQMGSTEIYISIEPTRLIKWNYWMNNGVQGCNWKYELRYFIESNAPMYTLQGTINNTNFFNLPNNGCVNGCTGLIYTANNDAAVCADVDFGLEDIIRIQIQNADISYRNITLNCNSTSPLPVELVSFTGINEERLNQLSWLTVSESNNDYFLLERSQNGMDWTFVGSINGAGTTSEQQSYAYTDATFTAGVNYYRLVQTDYDGTRNFSNVIAIDNSKGDRTLVQIVNLLGEQVTEDHSGIKLYVYSNGEVEKRY